LVWPKSETWISSLVFDLCGWVTGIRLVTYVAVRGNFEMRIFTDKGKVVGGVPYRTSHGDAQALAKLVATSPSGPQSAACAPATFSRGPITMFKCSL
jgi:hypothetical protein